jgi:hypothetical protein
VFHSLPHNAPETLRALWGITLLTLIYEVTLFSAKLHRMPGEGEANNADGPAFAPEMVNFGYEIAERQRLSFQVGLGVATR